MQWSEVMSIKFLVAMASISVCIGSVDITRASVREMQAEMMRNFFNAVRQTYVFDFSHGHPAGDVCGDHDHPEWKGIKCTNGIVQSVEYIEMQNGFFTLAQLPNTVRKIFIVESNQLGNVHTRFLPREALTVDLHSNRYGGQIYLDTFPEKLRDFNAYDNRLTGPLNFSRLPESMTMLDLSCNLITQGTIIIGRLPSHLEVVDLSKNEIEHKIALEPEFKARMKIIKMPRKGWKHSERNKKR